MTTANNTITLSLSHLDDFLGDPSAELWNPVARTRSGIDELLASLHNLPARPPANIEIYLPGMKLDEGFGSRLRADIDDYCAERIEANDGMVALIREKGRSDILIRTIALFFLAILALGLTYTVQSGTSLWSMVLGSVLILSWIFLRNPVFAYLRGWKPYERDSDNCRKLQAAAIRFASDSDDPVEVFDAAHHE